MGPFGAKMLNFPIIFRWISHESHHARASAGERVRRGRASATPGGWRQAIYGGAWTSVHVQTAPGPWRCWADSDAKDMLITSVLFDMFCLRLVLLRLLRFKISAGTRPQPWAPERQWASSRSQWALPDLNHAPELHKLQISARWASTASSRSQWALPDLNRKLQISVGTARPQPPAPDLSGHKMGRFVWSWTGYTRGCIYLLNLVALGTWWVCHLLGNKLQQLLWWAVQIYEVDKQLRCIHLVLPLPGLCIWVWNLPRDDLPNALSGHSPGDQISCLGNKKSSSNYSHRHGGATLAIPLLLSWCVVYNAGFVGHPLTKVMHFGPICIAPRSGHQARAKGGQPVLVLCWRALKP